MVPAAAFGDPAKSPAARPPARPPAPAADVNLLRVPQGPDDEHYLFLSDILPTAWHACEMGEVAAGDCVAIWGAGPVGILAAHCAQYRWAPLAAAAAAAAGERAWLLGQLTSAQQGTRMAQVDVDGPACSRAA
jgi:D-arabinose 1-dehydrogenase-like Zn-dependent alcohol dehydrogenase